MSKFTSLISATLLLVGTATLYTLFFFYIQGQIAIAAQARLDASGIEQQDQFQSSVASLLRNTDADRTELSSYVSNDSNIVNVIQSIEDRATLDHVTTKIISVAVGAAKWKYHEPLTITFSAEGTFSALTAFATDMESFPQASHLAKINAQVSTNHLWTATVTLEFLKEKAQPPTQ